MASFYLELRDDPLRFLPVNKDVNVFFDEGNKQVFAVSKKDDGSTNVSVTGGPTSFEFSLKDKGHVISIKFSPDLQILAVQRSARSVEFINFGSSSDVEYSQSCKGRNTQILGFCWTGASEVFFVTNQGLEFYQVQPDKACLKQLKSYNVNVNWFVYLTECSVLLLSSGVMGNVIHPYVFRTSTISRLPKFEVDTSPSTRTPQPPSLLERDVTLGNIYGNIYVIVLRNQSRTFHASGAEVALYQLQREIPAKKSCVLRLGAVGRFAVNTIDNLIVVHHQASKTSMLFDIGLSSDFDGQVAHFFPVLAPLPIEPFSVDGSTYSADEATGTKTCELYSPNWVVFQPNIIIDAKLGCLWRLGVKLDSLVNMVEDKEKLIDFLLLRQDSKQILLQVCRQLICPGQQINLAVISRAFDKVNSVYRELLDLKTQLTGQSQEAILDDRPSSPLYNSHSIIDQSDMYENVLQPFVNAISVQFKCKMAVLTEYIRSMNSCNVPVEHCIEEAIVKLLVKEKKFYQLYQYLQYHVLTDSKQMVALLLSLEDVYPHANQMALDMLKRLDANSEEIVETLLGKKEIVAALRFLQSVNAVESASPRKFLQAAYESENSMIFYIVFKFFQQRNLRMRKQVHFVKGEQCEAYERHFERMYGKERLDTEGDTIVEIVEGLDY